MKAKVFGTTLGLLFLLSLIIGCGSDNPLIQESSDNPELAVYKARQDEIARVDLAALSKITEKILAYSPDLSEEELRAEIFQKLLELKKSGKDEVLAGPYIPGYRYRLSWAEFWLLMRYPWRILVTNGASNDALAEARRQWSGMSTWKTKADAFRHAYWNILLAKRISLNWARDFTTAHESEERDLKDKEMDLHNNRTGRAIYKSNRGRSEASLSGIVKNYWYRKVSFRSTSTRYLVYLR